MNRTKLQILLLSLLMLSGPARAAEPGEHAIAISPWFTETFLDFREDVAEAARDGKRLMVYFGQDGCPYCRELIQTNFSQKAIVDKTRRHFTAIALNIWGDREVTWTDGRKFSEKQFAAFLRVQFTPTLLFFDERGGVVARLNGYYPPHRFEAALDYVAARMESRLSLAEHLRSAARESASPAMHEEAFFLKSPYDLRRKQDKPLAVLFETPYCAACDELHREGFRRREIRVLLARFDVARFALHEPTAIIAPDAARTNAADWARALGIGYAPSIVFFDASGKEVFRVESYLRAFHLRAALEYVASGAYRREPSFQRFVQDRARAMRDSGQAVDLWR